MTVRTHDSGWRTVVAMAPPAGVVFIVWAVLQGEREVAKSPPVLLGLCIVAALGLLVAAFTSWQLGRVKPVPVAQAQAGTVALSGKAQPLPGDEPLLSPNGEPCLWFKHVERIMHRTEAVDSVRPFLLVDDSGSVVVLPVGAQITGSSRQPMVAAASKAVEVDDITGRGDSGTAEAERLLRSGDEIHVFGRFVPPSAEALELQAKASAQVREAFVPTVVVRLHGKAASLREAMKLVPTERPPMPPPPPPAVPLALPVLTVPAGAQPYLISIGRALGEAGWFGFLAVVDALVLAGAGMALAWVTFSAR